MPSSHGPQPEKSRKTAGNGAGRGLAAQNGGRVFRNLPTGSAQDIHRPPPHSVEAEQGVLGSMLISPREAIAECVEKINDQYFYVPAHQTIYNVLVDLWNAGQAIDETSSKPSAARHSSQVCSRSFRRPPMLSTTWRSFATNTFCAKSFRLLPRVFGAPMRNRTR